MVRERSIDIAILFLNVIAITVLVAILSVMVNTADARVAVIETESSTVELFDLLEQKRPTQTV